MAYLSKSLPNEIRVIGDKSNKIETFFYIVGFNKRGEEFMEALEEITNTTKSSDLIEDIDIQE